MKLLEMDNQIARSAARAGVLSIQSLLFDMMQEYRAKGENPADVSNTTDFILELDRRWTEKESTNKKTA